MMLSVVHGGITCDVCVTSRDIIMPGKSADSGPEMTLRTRRGCNWTPYWHQSLSRLCFLLAIYFLMLFAI